VALLRILVDGYSLLHNWPELAPEAARHSEAARDELIYRLTQYSDAVGTPITVVFDGANSARGRRAKSSPTGLEILFSKAGQTADEVIERAAHRLSAYGEVLVVTDDSLERETVSSVGGMTSSCFGFIQTVESVMTELDRDIKLRNRREGTSFRRSR